MAVTRRTLYARVRHDSFLIGPMLPEFCYAESYACGGCASYVLRMTNAIPFPFPSGRVVFVRFHFLCWGTWDFSSVAPSGSGARHGKRG